MGTTPPAPDDEGLLDDVEEVDVDKLKKMVHVTDADSGADAGRARPIALAVAGLVGLLLFAVVADAARFEPTVTGKLRFAFRHSQFPR